MKDTTGLLSLEELHVLYRTGFNEGTHQHGIREVADGAVRAFLVRAAKGHAKRALSLLKTRALRVRVPNHPTIVDQASGPTFYVIDCDVYNDLVSILEGKTPQLKSDA